MNKKLFLLSLCVILSVLLCACNNIAPTTTPVPVPTRNPFNDDDVVLTFGMISDFQTRSDSRHYTHAHMDTAFKMLKGYNPDIVCVVGDLAENGKQDQITAVSNIYDKYFKDKVPMFYCMGNHDIQNGECRTMYQTVFGKYNYKYDVENIQNTGNRHAVVNGYHFLAVDVESYNTRDGSYDAGGRYSSSTIEWLDKTLAKITSENPNQYVFIITHLPIYNTVYGSTRITQNTFSWYTKELFAVLDKYPQAVTFGGHIHYTLDAETSIWQGNFTALGTSAVAYTCFEDIFANDTLTGELDVMPHDAEKMSQGYVLKVDSLGNVRITRLDFTEGKVIKRDFVLKTPAADRSHLIDYNFDYRMSYNTPPTWVNSDAQILLSNAANGAQPARLTGTAATDDDMVYYYEVEFIRNGTLERTAKYITDMYKAVTADDMSKTIDINLYSLKQNSEYEIRVYAVDIWKVRSEPQIIKIKTATIDDSSLPVPFMDVDTKNNTLVDIQSNVTFTKYGSVATVNSIFFNGKTYNYPATHLLTPSTAYVGSYKVSAFPEKLKQIYNAGVTFEIFFSDLAPSTDTRPIMSCMQNNGWEMSVQNGRLCFKIYTGSSGGKFNFVYCDLPNEGLNLNHVVAVFDSACKTLRLYLNGKLVDAVGTVHEYITKNDPQYVSIGSSFNNDIKLNNNGANILLADAKIYHSALTDNQVKLAYDTAVENLSK